MHWVNTQTGNVQVVSEGSAENIEEHLRAQANFDLCEVDLSKVTLALL